MKEYGVGVLGFGTVGAGVVETLLKNGDLLAGRLGVRPVLKGVADLDITTDRGVAVPEGLLTTDAAGLIARDGVDIVVELIGGCGVARKFVLAALERGKRVVTANKKLLAEHGEELFAAAEAHGTEILFEASVGGGIPIIKALREGLCANRIESAYGILNGTCNYILTRMEEEGLPFDEVLAAAQAAGYAEAEPSLDIDGLDTAHKAAVLARLAYGGAVPLDKVSVKGIRGLAKEDIRYAAEMGYRLKLLAILRSGGGGIEVSVQPTLVPRAHPLGAVSGVFNAVQVRGDTVGTTLYYGRGAGRAATASAVVADIADAALNLRAGGCRREGARGAAELAFCDPSEVRSRFYLRFAMNDEPGTMGRVTECLGRHRIGIESVMQKETRRDGGYVPVVMTTHEAPAGALGAALDEIAALAGTVEGAPAVFRIEDFSQE
ncbi:MAG: homoserine dehydrogenase [Kiritimatiellae bacterium]|nr:homoserine dehydrogenase [Kiritimatiellia bacterium]